MCPMEIAYCFHSIAAGCSNADEVGTAQYHCPSLNLIAEDYFEDLVQTSLFDFYRLEREIKLLVISQQTKKTHIVPGMDDPPGVCGLEGIGKLFI